MRTTVCLLIVALAGISGCGAKPPTTSHGQPISHWLEKIQDSDPETRLKAVKALANVGVKDPVVVPTFTAAVKDADAEVRVEAILSLLRIGPPARDAIPALMEAAQDSDATVREAAGKALVRIRGS